MLIKDYLSIQETIDFVFDLTGNRISHSIIEELSNVNQLTPVFLFSGHVAYPVDGVTVYEKMKAYFTHDDFFMHKTRNYMLYPVGVDVDAPEWIEINTPFIIKYVVKQQMSLYGVLDEVFLFTRTIGTEVGKLDPIRFTQIDFDDVRFSRNELLSLFKNNKQEIDSQLSQITYDNEIEQANRCAQAIADEKKESQLIVDQKHIEMLIAENNKLKAKLENQGYLDPNNKFFSIEMKLCHDTWNELYKNSNNSRLGHTTQAANYLKSHP